MPPEGRLRHGVRSSVAHDKWTRLSPSVLTNYPDLEAFRLSFVKVVDRTANDAILRGHPMYAFHPSTVMSRVDP